MNKKKFIKYPYEYIAAQIEFGLAVARVKRKKDLKAVFKTYTDIYGVITNNIYADMPGNEWVKVNIKTFEKLLSTEKDPTILSQKVYDLFLATPHRFDIYPSPYINEPLRFGCFKLNYSDYYKNQKVVRLHFSPLREGLANKNPVLRTSDLSPVYLEERKKDFSTMIQYIYDNPLEFKGATHFYSSTWLQNLDVYKGFFPRTKRYLNTGVYYWLWGQFIKWDYTGNKHRLSTFKKSLEGAKTMAQVINAVPYKIYDVKIPLKKMFAYYGLSTKKVAVPVSDFAEVPLQFVANPLLPTHTVYQSEE
jgi:hypothetical protein